MHDPANGFPRILILGSRVNKGSPPPRGWHERALSTKRCGVNALLLAQPGLAMGNQAGPRLLAGLVFFGFYQCYETVKQARAHGDSDDRNRTVRRYATNRYGYHMDVPHG
jgi:hypothetical protein